ncbi:MAG: DNA repair protein RecN [Anaerolineales bacterium]|nr:DNA repair protein RecN [Anaerolineales bacterium]
MLTELHIENFAIIERLDVNFERGLVTFTGETGAGKSIIIDAVETLVGGRAEATQVRAGAERANLEAVFRIPEASRKALHAILEREQLLDDPDFLAVGREIRPVGRNVARVNGRSVSASLLRELGEFLVDVHGQSEHLSLLRISNHLELLDRYAATHPHNPLQALLKAYQADYQRLQSVQRETEELRQAEQDASRRADMLAYQAQEIETARLRPDEEEALRQERDRLANAEGLASLTQEALLALDEGSPQEPAATDLVGRVTDALEGLARLDPSHKNLHEGAQALFEGLNDLARDLRLYLESIEFNPKRLDQVEERLALIHTLKRKYGETIPDVLEFAANARRQMDEITHAAERLEALDVERQELLKRLGARGSELSRQRHEAAQKLEGAIEKELADLNMSGARFQVDFQQHSAPDGAPLQDGRRLAFNVHGLERIEFLIAPNPGEGFKPLAKIASGGETSRLMLALKNVLVQADHVPTLIFDEIDQGIGGRVGAIVGQKLWRLARQHQVLCITHLPQLAAFGEQHFRVEKQVHEGRTITLLKRLEDQDRLVELAQMLGNVSEGTLQSARELVQAVKDQKTKTRAIP